MEIDTEEAKRHTSLLRMLGVAVSVKTVLETAQELQQQSASLSGSESLDQAFSQLYRRAKNIQLAASIRVA